ncbi:MULTISPECIES: TetR/AcrR family transcriptional regulator [Nocardiopsidaceae]|uniref:TetR/AcrR family transcriptional regulator n=1 Tax=Streptomonospora nanhaiensis TaxID=1323731 RepID=A0ABY6YLZ1_9ACTN|nr:TetR/AcrR family transcriptional regulator [Streptomonospora nanhaiensis]WAE73233.1 TetR/AcrR family transcriptional regulator [Streptomonospora nanhaiensis]
MGHKEQLLEGAKQCLYTKGYARTTSRDIVAASGANLASIGYHYGSKEVLLTTAMIAVVGEWSDRVLAVLSAADGGSAPVDRFEETMNRLVRSLGDVRTMVAANFEVLAQLDRMPELRDQLAGAHRLARRGLAAVVLGVPVEQVTDEQEDTVGSLMLTLVPGVMAQSLVSPGETPDGTRLAAAIRALLPQAPGSAGEAEGGTVPGRA